MPISRSILMLVLAGAVLSDCTAIGAWVYDDPSFTLHTVTMRQDSLDLILSGCNRNDYDLLGEGFRVRVAVAGETVAEGGREQPVFLATRDSSEFTVTIPLRAGGMVSQEKPRAYAVDAAAILRTPAGDRPLAFLLRGRVGERDGTTAWTGKGVPCRLGSSNLPSVFDRRTPLGAPRPELPPARPSGPGGK